jgi:hypothetical protein
MDVGVFQVKDEFFSSFEVLTILDMPRERLKDWIARNYIKPYKPAQGKGYPAVFTRLNLYQIAIFKKLVEMGLSRDKAAEIVNQLEDQDPKAESLGFLVYMVINKGGVLDYEPRIVERGKNLAFQTEIASDNIIIKPIRGQSIEFEKEQADNDIIYDLEYYSVINLLMIGLSVDKKIDLIQEKKANES